MIKLRVARHTIQRELGLNTFIGMARSWRTFGGSGDSSTKESISKSIARQNHELVDGVWLEVMYSHGRRSLTTRYNVDRLPVITTIMSLVPTKVNKLKVKRHSSPEQVISELRGVTCHIGSHGVTFYPTQVNAHRLTPARQAGTRLSYAGGLEGWVHLDFGVRTETVNLSADSHRSK